MESGEPIHFRFDVVKDAFLVEKAAVNLCELRPASRFLALQGLLDNMPEGEHTLRFVVVVIPALKILKMYVRVA